MSFFDHNNDENKPLDDSSASSTNNANIEEPTIIIKEESDLADITQSDVLSETSNEALDSKVSAAADTSTSLKDDTKIPYNNVVQSQNTQSAQPAQPNPIQPSAVQNAQPVQKQPPIPTPPQNFGGQPPTGSGFDNGYQAVGLPNQPKKTKRRIGLYLLILFNIAISGTTLFMLKQHVDDTAARSSYDEDEEKDDNDIRLPEITQMPENVVSKIEFGREKTEKDEIKNKSNPTEEIIQNVGDSIASVLVYDVEDTDDGEQELHAGSGSGIVLSTDGYLLTNYHVVKDTDLIYVLLEGSNEQLPATLLGFDPVRDVAVIHVDQELQAPVFGDSSKLKKGDLAIAIGSPLGTLNGTATQGIISAPNRSLEMSDGFLQTFIQTDAPINPGNSGGALVNSAGDIIGMNTLKSTIVGIDDYGMPISAEGIGYALPINDVLKIARTILEEGHSSQLRFGFKVSTVTLEEAIEEKTHTGAYVTRVRKGSTAEVAGLKKGDIICDVNDKEIKTISDIGNAIDISSTEPATFRIWRNGKFVTFDIEPEFPKK